MRTRPPLIRPPDDIVREFPEEIYSLIGKIASAWSRLDMALLLLLMDASGTDAGIVGLFVGRLDSRGKLDRLMSILQYRKLNSQLAALKRLRPDLAKMQLQRNHVVHGDLLGIHKTSGEFIFVVADYWADEETQVPIMSALGYSKKKLEWNKNEITRLTDEIQKIEIPKP